MVSTPAETKRAEQYRKYKESYVKQLRFDPEKPNQSELKAIRSNWHILISASVIEHAPLEAVYIFFDTATYDQIERDVKVGDNLV